MFIEITDAQKNVKLVRLDDIQAINKIDDKSYEVFIYDYDNLKYYITDREYQRIRNKLKDANLLL